MKKIILTFGLIAGAIVSVIMVISMPLYEKGILNFDNGQWVGYTSMVIALSMVFFGVKSYRDNYHNGSITFGQGFKIGILITIIASVIYAVSWEISYNTMAADFTEKVFQHYMEEKKKSVGTEAEIKQAVQQMETMKELYKNPLFRFGMTLMEILPVGLAITLVSAGLLRKKEILPAT